MANITYVYTIGDGLTKQIRATAPAARTNGKALAESEIDSYLATIEYYSPDPSVPVAVTRLPNLQLVEVEPGVRAFNDVVQIDTLAEGRYVYSFQTVDTVGQLSAPSDTVTLEISLPLVEPNPPTIDGLV